MEFKDYYTILGVGADADVTAIKSAYRKLARKYHPDVNPEPGAEAKFKEVAEAYKVLKDTERRAEYDELRRYGGSRPGGGFEPPPGWKSKAGAGYSGSFSGEGFSDFFSSIFGDGYQQGRGGRFGIKGQDIEIELPIFLEETIKETQKPIKYQSPVYSNGEQGLQHKSLKVKIPAGVTDGERIRLKGQGGSGRGDAPAGDLYLHIRLVPHPLFDVEGHNLVITIPVAPWEAALGAKVVVPTLDGKIHLAIKPNSQTGQRLRIQGKGLVSKVGRGDLFAVLKVVMPTTANDKTHALWEALAKEADFDPRTQWS